jgi:hypothetical protein
MASNRVPKRIRKFLRVAPRERNNSNSIRRLLFDVVWQDFERSTMAAAQRFKQILHEAKDARKFRLHGKGLSGWSVYRVTRDAQSITYTQLDAMAQHLDIPMSLLLLFTRVRSEVELADGHDPHGARSVLTAMRSAIDKLESLLHQGDGQIEDVYKHLSHEQFNEVRRVYLAKIKEMRTSLV